MKHLLNGISRMIPFVVAGAIFAAFFSRVAPQSAVAPFLRTLGPEGGLALMFPVLAGFIAQSIAGWDGLLPGMLGGLIAYKSGSGMLGAILSGYLAGYVARALGRFIPLPAALTDLKPILVTPALSALVVGGVMIYVVNPPAVWVMKGLQSWLIGLQGGSSLLLGALLGAMACVDMGGPINKAASLFALDLLAAGIAEPMGAVVAGVFVPALGLCLSMRLAPRRYTAAELTAGRTTFYLGLINIIEGTIPVAMADPRRVIPAMTVGGAVAGAICMMLGVGVRLPVGGVFTPLIPGMVTHVGPYLLAVAVGAVVTAAVVTVLKPAKT